MTLEEAREHIEEGVVYTAAEGTVEDGVIVSVGEQFVFVRYGADKTAKATHPAALTLLAVAGTEGPG